MDAFIWDKIIAKLIAATGERFSPPAAPDRNVEAARFTFKQYGQLLLRVERKDALPTLTDPASGIFEREWMLGTACVERAFALEPPAREADKRAAEGFFLKIKNSKAGVYATVRDLIAAHHLTRFDALAVQLPDSPIICLRENAVVALIGQRFALRTFAFQTIARQKKPAPSRRAARR